MRITELKTLNGSPYKTISDMATDLNVTKQTVRHRIEEMEQERDRYGDYSIIRDGGIVLINYLAFIDFIKWRKRLAEKNLRKTVPEYNPQRLAFELGWYGKE